MALPLGAAPFTLRLLSYPPLRACEAIESHQQTTNGSRPTVSSALAAKGCRCAWWACHKVSCVIDTLKTNRELLWAASELLFVLAIALRPAHARSTGYPGSKTGAAACVKGKGDYCRCS